MNIRITLSRATVKAMQSRLQQAYARGDVRLVRRISALLEHLQQQTEVSALRACKRITSDSWRPLKTQAEVGLMV